MKTINDIIELVRHFMKEDTCNMTMCKYCSKLNWCNVDSYLLTLDYLINNEY